MRRRRDADPSANVDDAQHRALAEPNTILRCVVGSTVHGLSVKEHDDRDEMGVCVEPLAHYFGLRERFEQWTYRTKAMGERSGPGDLDLTVYSLAKWARLALRGNPTILIVLFAPPPFVVSITAEGEALRALAPCFVGDALVDRYLGYMRQQRQRLMNRVKMPSRPELIAQYGFDTKYAGHLIRLGHQGLELATTRRLTLPMPEPARQRVLDVRLGRVTEREVLEEAAELESQLLRLQARAELGPPDGATVERFVLDTYMARYRPEAR